MGSLPGESRRSEALQLLLIAFKTFTKRKLFNLSEAPFAIIRDLLKLAIMQQVKKKKKRAAIKGKLICESQTAARAQIRQHIHIVSETKQRSV